MSKGDEVFENPKDETGMDEVMRNCGMPSFTDFKRNLLRPHIEKFVKGTEIPRETMFNLDDTKHSKIEGPYQWGVWLDDFQQDSFTGDELRGRLIGGGKLLVMVRMGGSGAGWVPMYGTVIPSVSGEDGDVPKQSVDSAITRNAQ